jgi:hypothetical protein
VQDDMFTTSEIDILYESYVASLFVNKGYAVRRTPKTGDFGADLLVHSPQPPHDLLYVVQCKYSSTSPVGNDAVHEAFSARHYYKAEEAIVVAPRQFTRHAHETAEKLNVKLFVLNMNAWETGAASIPAVSMRESIRNGTLDWARFCNQIEQGETAPWMVVETSRFKYESLLDVLDTISPFGVGGTLECDRNTSEEDMSDNFLMMRTYSLLVITNFELCPKSSLDVLYAARDYGTLFYATRTNINSRVLAPGVLAPHGVVIVTSDPLSIAAKLPPDFEVMWAKESDFVSLRKKFGNARRDFIPESKVKAIAEDLMRSHLMESNEYHGNLTFDTRVSAPLCKDRTWYFEVRIKVTRPGGLLKAPLSFETRAHIDALGGSSSFLI